MFRKLIIKVLIFTIIVVYGAVGILYGDGTDSPKKSILLLNSYNEGYKWTDDIVSTVEKKINGSKINCNIDIEYMNSKHIHDDQYFEMMYELYKYKYSKRKYDVIIASDDDAYRFLVKFGDELFSGVPVVYCGVSKIDENDAMENRNMTGIIEELGLDETVSVIRDIHPGVKGIFVITDRTTLGRMAVEDITDVSRKHPSITFTISNNDYIKKAIYGLSKLNSDNVVILTPALLKNDDGEFLSTNEIAEMITKNTKLPVYTTSNYFMGDGVIGGKISNAAFQGNYAARMALEILEGQKIDNVPPIFYNSTQFVFDYNGLKKFNIRMSELPKGSKIINRAVNSYNLPANILWGGIILFICLLIYIDILLLVNVKSRRRAETDLRYEEKVLRTLINGMPDIVYFKDINGKWLEANKAAASLLEIEDLEYKGKSDDDLAVIKDGFQNPFTDYERKYSGGCEENGSLPDEKVLIDKYGNNVVYSITVVPVEDHERKERGIIIIARDITIRKNALQALEQSEGILRATLNATADGILVTNFNKRILECNQLLVKMWQFPRSVVEKKEVIPLYQFGLSQVHNPQRHREWVARCHEQMQASFDTIYLKNGKVFEVYSDVLTINNMVQGRVWSFKDVTERKRVEMELQKSEERYRRLVELSPDAIYMAVGAKTVFANAAGIELLRAAGEEQIYGRSILDFMSEEYAEVIKDGLFIQSEHSQVFPLAHFKLKRMDDTIVDVEAATIAFAYDGETAVLSVVRDISERKEAEQLKISVEEKTRQLTEALEYDKLKTEFFSNISHELRTPINVILGAQKIFELLLKEVDLGRNQEKVAKYVNMMRQNCYRLTRLVNNLIDITRIDTGFFSVNLRNFDIVNIVECITMSVAEYIQDKGIALIFDTEIEEKVIACDDDKIERIMLNLLSNAVKFTDDGGSIVVHMKEEAGSIVITVSDTGIGIPEDKLEAVFDRFVQVDKSFIRSREGSGIGLSIVKSLVDLLGGSVSIRSKVNEGTTFEIKLPAVLVSEEEIAVADEGYQSSAERINIEFSDIYI